jgi:succinate-acetate transporter protein
MFFVLVCRNGILVPSFLPHRTSPEAAALAIYRIVIKLYVVCCYYVVIKCLFCCCFYFSSVVVAAATLAVGLCTMTHVVIFAPLYVGLLRALLYNHCGFFPSRLSGRLPLC